MRRNPPKQLAVVMAKAPLPGKVKTRLAPPMTFQEAAQLYRCFLQDRLLEMGTLTEADVAVAYTPARAAKSFAALCPERFNLFPQEGRTLGARMFHIFQKMRSRGYAAVTVTGSDLPDLPNRILLEAFEYLLAHHADLVFGPTPDGGYYLIGAKKPYPELFSEIPWSTENVLAASVQIAERLGLKIQLLSVWNDLDTFQDLVQYHRNFPRRNPKTGTAGSITHGFLENFIKRAHPASLVPR